MVVVTKSKFLEAINLEILPSTIFMNLNNNIFKALYKMEYEAKLKGVAEFKKGKLLGVS